MTKTIDPYVLASSLAPAKRALAVVGEGRIPVAVHAGTDHVERAPDLGAGDVVEQVDLARFLSGDEVHLETELVVVISTGAEPATVPE